MLTMPHLLWLVFVQAFGLVLTRPDIKGWNTICFGYQRDLNILYLRAVSGQRPGSGPVIICDPDNRLESGVPIVATEALRYQVEKINARMDILPNVSLGFIVVDVCTQDLAALAAMFYALPNKADQDRFPDDQLITCEEDMKSFDNVIGAVGPSFSTGGVMVGAVSSLFEFPLVMTWATSDELSDKTRFAYTMRLVPPDSFAAEAIIDLMIELGWNYAALFYMEGSYGENGAKQVERQAKEKGVCLAYSAMLPSGSALKDVDDIVARLMKFDNVKVIISYLFSSQVRQFKTVLESYERETYYSWLGSDSFPTDGEGLFFDGTIFVDFDINYDREFHKHFAAINPVNTPDNPWIPYFWEKQHKCKWNGSNAETPCQDVLEKPHGYNIDITNGEGKPMDGVSVFAHALHQLLRDKCPSAFGNRSLIRQCVNGRDLHKYMLNSSFDGFSGKIKFNKKGDFLGKYVFRQYQHTTNSIEAVAVWDKIDGSLDVFHDRLHWFSWTGNNTNKSIIPEAVCSRPCETKEYYIQKELPCCWECRKCRENEIIINETKCEVCPITTWPDIDTATICQKIEPDFLTWTSPLTMAILAITGLGFLLCIIVAAIFVKNKESKLIKASSRQLMGIILCGIVLAYLTVISLLYQPSTISCYLSRFGFNLSVSFIYSPLMIKTSRVYRIFSAGKRGKVRPALTGTRAQLVMVIVCIAIEMLLCTVSAIQAPPDPIYRMQVRTLEYVEVLCSLPLIGLLPPLCLNLLFILACAAYGFLTRKLPENFNESWYIFVSVATTTFLWLVFLPAYFTAFYAIHQVSLLMCCLIINATITLLCLYFPKIYCIYFLNENDIQFQTAGTIAISNVAPAPTNSFGGVSSNTGTMQAP